MNGRYIRGYGIPDYTGKAAGTAAAAIDKLAKPGVINSPDYRKSAAGSDKAAESITKAGQRSSTPENGIGNLFAAGISDTPDYWLAHYHDYLNVGALLCALGGAVK